MSDEVTPALDAAFGKALNDRVYEIAFHSHSPGLRRTYFHAHAWGNDTHNHMLRAVCTNVECQGFETHNIHPSHTSSPPEEQQSRYRVVWEVDVWAESPWSAAEKALEMQRDPESIATVFKVTGETGNMIEIDLGEEEPYE